MNNIIKGYILSLQLSLTGHTLNNVSQFNIVPSKTLSFVVIIIILV